MWSLLVYPPSLRRPGTLGYARSLLNETIAFLFAAYMQNFPLRSVVVGEKRPRHNTTLSLISCCLCLCCSSLEFFFRMVFFHLWPCFIFLSHSPALLISALTLRHTSLSLFARKRNNFLSNNLKYKVFILLLEHPYWKSTAIWALSNPRPFHITRTRATASRTRAAEWQKLVPENFNNFNLDDFGRIPSKRSYVHHREDVECKIFIFHIHQIRRRLSVISTYIRINESAVKAKPSAEDTHTHSGLKALQRVYTTAFETSFLLLGHQC